MAFYKNTANQKVGAQMIDASDGSAFTGSVTVAVTGDAGTQATGSVGSGACTHEGGGYHTYAPAQAETNYELVAFTFSGTGAIPVTVSLYTLPGPLMVTSDVQQACEDAIVAEGVFRVGQTPVTFSIDSTTTVDRLTSGVTLTEE